MSPPAAIFPNLDLAAAKSNPSAPSGSVLLVEDDESLADLLKHLLTRMHLRVVHASTGAMAANALAEHGSQIALAIVDCHLPDMGRDIAHREGDTPVMCPIGWRRVEDLVVV